MCQMFVGSFEPDDFNGFQTDVQAATAAFKTAGVSQLIIDLSNNGGQCILLAVWPSPLAT
jgi:C-terminal processing protease CtpA/Prc